MTWEQTHRRQRILREAEQLADLDPSGRVPWRPEYTEVFADPDELLEALRYRWRLRLEAQLDPDVPDAASQLERTSSRLVRENAGLLRVLRRYPRSDGEPSEQPWEERYVRAS